MSISWEQATYKRGVYQKLDVTAKDVRPISMYTFTFFLSEGKPARPDRHPYYTATGITPEAAEQAAYIVYMRAVRCQHRFVKVGTYQQKCQLCDVRLDSLQSALIQQTNVTSGDEPLTTAPAKSSKAAKEPSGLRKLFSFKR